jgi:serine/threonine protein phosphatase PrpC
MKNQNYPGLAMSRSLGDLVASSIGVTCDPGIFYLILEILEFEITDYSRFIVIASDGIWEFLDNNRVMNVVNSYYLKNDAEGACHALVKEATDWWEKVKNSNLSIGRQCY